MFIVAPLIYIGVWFFGIFAIGGMIMKKYIGHYKGENYVLMCLNCIAMVLCSFIGLCVSTGAAVVFSPLFALGYIVTILGVIGWSIRLLVLSIMARF